MTLRFAIALVCGALLCGCRDAPEIIEVKCIEVHRYGETRDKHGWADEPFSYMTVERTDTHERRSFREILGQPNDVFKMDWNRPHYE